MSVPHVICEMCAKEAADREESPIQHSGKPTTKKHGKCKFTKTSTEIGRLFGPDVLFLDEMYNGKTLSNKRVVCKSQKMSIYLVSQENFMDWLQKAYEAKMEKVRRRNDPTFVDTKKFDNWILTLDIVSRVVADERSVNAPSPESTICELY